MGRHRCHDFLQLRKVGEKLHTDPICEQSKPPPIYSLHPCFVLYCKVSQTPASGKYRGSLPVDVINFSFMPVSLKSSYKSFKSSQARPVRSECMEWQLNTGGGV